VSLRGALAAALAALALASCGGSDEEEEATPDEPPSTASRPEHRDRPAKLPDSWSAEANRRGGFSFGVPRGWQAERRGSASLVRSFDRLVAISMAADRSPEGLELAPGEFARQTAEELRGYRGEPRLGRERSFGHPRYAGAEVRATATARGGVGQRLSVITLRSGEAANVTAVIAENERRASDSDERLARAVVRTVRTRPPAAQRSGRSG
jgi:hypothetical protein